MKCKPFDLKRRSHAQWYTSAILVPDKLRQKDHKFKASLGYRVRLYLKNIKLKKKKTTTTKPNQNLYNQWRSQASEQVNVLKRIPSARLGGKCSAHGVSPDDQHQSMELGIPQRERPCHGAYTAGVGAGHRAKESRSITWTLCLPHPQPCALNASFSMR